MSTTLAESARTATGSCRPQADSRHRQLAHGLGRLVESGHLTFRDPLQRQSEIHGPSISRSRF
jgi:hypothetical protein